MNKPLDRHLYANSRLAFYGSVCLVVQVITITIFATRHYALHDEKSPALGIDFSVFWVAARVALDHGAAAIYSPEYMAPLERLVRPLRAYTPWPYPPTFLLFVVPFGFLPFGVALASFLVITTALYVCCIHAIARPIGIPSWRYALAFPAFFVVVAFGQNSFLTVAIAGTALLCLPKRPILAGALIALLSIKPQLGVLFPLFLICNRQWRALTSAAVFTLLLLAASTLTFGIDTFTVFLHAITAFGHEWLGSNAGEIWYALTTVYGVARVLGENLILAYSIHIAFVLPAITASVWLWRCNARYELRAATLAIGAILVPPYIVLYDLAWLALPIAFLAVDMNKHGASRGEIALLVVAWFTPVQALSAEWFRPIGQWTPAVLLALLGLIVLRHLRALDTPANATSQTNCGINL